MLLSDDDLPHGACEIDQWLGHKSVNTTMIYAYLAPQDDEINVL